MWLALSIIFLTSFFSLYIYSKWIYGYWKRRNIPYLTPTYPIGNFEPPWAINEGFHKTMANTYNEFKKKGYKYGGIFSFLRPTFVPVDLDIIKHIMIKDFQYFVDRGVYYNEKTDPLSAHLFSMEGDKWRSLRARLSPTFTSGKMKSMFQIVMDCGKGLQDGLRKRATGRNREIVSK
ncbi:Cytochrome P450 [Popillia japonica]|uniref:Cytochrome P450 n=1 Tax=Popillia japonica TaxID=7064 RepID=A0AAW1J0Z4_POPJA